MIPNRLRIFLFSLFLSSTLSAQLSGTYTIGGNSPDFVDFTTAVAALTDDGISGNVDFKVRAGVYTEQFALGTFPGNTGSRTVTFEAENGDANSVLVTFNSTAQINNHIVYLISNRNIIFKNLSFKSSETSDYSNIFTLFSVENCSIENCILSGSILSSTQSTNSRNSVTVSGKSPDFLVRNCLFKNGYRAIGIYGGNTSFSPDIVIEKCQFKYVSFVAVYAQFAHNIQLSENYIDSCFGGFNIGYSDQVFIEKNQIYTNGYGAMSLTECIGTPTNRTLISNNMIGVYGDNGQGTGVLLQSCRYADFVHNSLNVLTGDNQSIGLYLSNSSRYINIQNNSIVTLDKGEPVRLLNEPNEIDSFSHNNLYNQLIISDLPSNSISVDPHYLDRKDLHVSNAILNDLGTPLLSVSTDFDDEIRSASTPDIGADEYIPVQLSVGLIGVVNPNADSVYCSDLSLEVIFQNTGLTTLTSSIFNVKINGVQLPPIDWTGILPSGENEQIALGNLSLLALQANEIVIEITNPNSSTDDFLRDNKLTYSKVYTGLSGTYTIGGTNPDFPDFTSAVTALQTGGLCGAVTMLVRDGIYNENIRIQTLRGSSNINWLTFRGESGDSSAVALIAPGTQYNNTTFSLRSCRFVRLESMTIQQTQSSYLFAPCFITQGTDIELKSCVFQGYNSFSGTRSQYALNAYVDSNFTVQNCVFKGGSKAVQLVGVGPIKYNLIFENNQLVSGGDDCLNLQKWRNVSIRNNYFFAASGNSLYGIYGLNLYNYNISENRIGISGVQATVGMYLINCREFQNDISLVSNNSISMNLSAGPIAVSRGMWIIGCDSIQILHNTVRFNSTDLDNRAIEIQTSPSPVVLNNVFANIGLGLSLSEFGNSNAIFDHNLYFTNGATLCSGGGTDLMAVQTLTGGDQNSIVADPLWTSSAMDSLALRDPNLAYLGRETQVLEDIFGYPRPFPEPNIGAFETPLAPTVTLGGDTTVCGKFIIDGATPGATTYLWNTGATSSEICVTTSGMYILTATNNIGSSTDTIVVSLQTAPTVNAGFDTTLCSGTAFQLNGSSSADCIWMDVSGNVLNTSCSFIDTATNSQTYILTATASNGCIAKDSLELTTIELPTVNAGQDTTVCAGEAVELLGISSEACTWLDESGSVLSNSCILSINASQTSVYILESENFAACTSRDSVFVTVIPTPLVDAGLDYSVCENEVISLEGQSSTSCTWTDISGTILSNNCSYTFTASTSGQFILTANDGAMCETSDTVFLTVFGNPVAPNVEENNGILSVNTNDNVQWLLAGIPISGATNTTYIPTESGSYSVEITNTFGCTAYSTPYFFETSGIEKLAEIDFTIFPNPTMGGMLNFGNSNGFKPVGYAIFNNKGQKVSSGNMITSQTSIELLDLKGLFYLKIWDKEDRYTYRAFEVL